MIISTTPAAQMHRTIQSTQGVTKQVVAHFSFARDFTMGIGKLKLRIKFEVSEALLVTKIIIMRPGSVRLSVVRFGAKNRLRGENGKNTIPWEVGRG